MENKRLHRLRWVGVNVSRLLLSVVFVLSGFVKLVDPRGTQYKLEDYFAAFGMADWMLYGLPLFLSIGLAVAEFSLGLYMFYGIRRKTTSGLLTLFLLIMTPLTLYLAIANPVSDCGCFGDAIRLTNWETFGKNIILLIAAVVTMRYHRHMTRFITERNQWLISMYTVVFALCLSLFCIYRLPVLDFRPYHIGANLRKGVMHWQEEDAVRYSTIYVMEKDGMQKDFAEDEYPDSTWTFIDAKTVEVGDRSESQYQDFCMELLPTMEDVTEKVLTNDSYTFFLIAPRLEQADDSNIDRINELNDYCVDRGYSFYCLTASDGEAITYWQDMTGAEYDFCQADEIELKTIVRANPGLLLIKDGVIVDKWNCNTMPDEYDLTAPLEELSWAKEPQYAAFYERVFTLILWYIIPLLLFTLADRLWVVQKFYKRFKHKNKIINQLNFREKNMRKKIVAGNWKMNLNLQEGIALATELNNALAADKPNCDVVICTPFIHLASVAGIIDSNVIGLGAENCADKTQGAYTGEVSASMVKSTGANYVILGHSERRAYYGETAEILKEKVNLALANGLKVIFCIGEVLEEREAEKQNEVVKAQLEGSLFDLTTEEFANIILAYEPVWAIGTGKTATSEQAEEMHAFIRETIAEKFGAEAAENVSILYGGSCKPSNAKEIFAKPNVDGGLIGGAALKVEDFKGIIDAWKA